MSITVLPTPPQRTMPPAVFVPTADAFIAALPQFVTDANATAATMTSQLTAATTQATNAANSATAAAGNATAAAASAAQAQITTNVTQWNASTNYSTGVYVFSPVTFATYIRKAPGGVTATDPSGDPTNWRVVTYYLPWIKKNANYTANVQEMIAVDTSGGSVTITLPPASLCVPAVTTVTFKDYSGTWGTNNMIVNGNSSPIEGLNENMTVGINFLAFILTYMDATRGWVIA